MSDSIATVSAGFRELLTRIELNATRVALASQRYAAVSDRIVKGLPNCEVRQIGSFQRRTKIRPLKDSDSIDVDAIVCFGGVVRYANDGTSPADALSIVRKALESDETYKLMEPAADTPTVVLEYSDGFKMELVPCYREKTGKYPRPSGPACYIVGAPGGLWVPADYDYDAAYISGTNQLEAIGQALVPSIKMVKAFLRGHSVSLKSFHVEVLCATLIPPQLADWEGKNLRWDYQYILAHFLSNAHTLLTGPLRIPGSYSSAVDSGMSTYGLGQIGQELARWGERAWKICKVQDEAQALKYWREFYGDPFPAC